MIEAPHYEVVHTPRYAVALRAPWEFYTLPFPAAPGCPRRAYEGRFLDIENDERGGVSRVSIAPYAFTADSVPVCDGPTWAPRIRPAVIASLFHDPAYLERREIAACFGVSEAVVRAWADRVFRALMLAHGASWPVAALYWRGIRIGYPVYRLFNPD